MATVEEGTSTKGGRYVHKEYEANDYRTLNLVPEGLNSLKSSVPKDERVLL